MKIRKILNVFIASLLAVMLLASCGSSNDVQVMRNGDSEEQTISQTAKDSTSENTTTAKPADDSGATTTAETTAEITAETEPPEPAENNILPLMIKTDINNYSFQDNSIYLTADYKLMYTTGSDDNKTEPAVMFENVRDTYVYNDKYNFILKTDNTLWVYGDNRDNELGPKVTAEDKDGFDVEVNYYTYENAVLAANDVANITTGGEIIKTDKTVWDWNGNVEEDFFTQLDYTNVVEFDSKYDWYLKATGELYSTGGTLYASNIKEVYKSSGYSFFALTTDNKLINIEDGNAVVAEDVAEVFDYGFAYVASIIKNDGTLWTMGANFAAQVGDGSKTDRDEFVKIADDVIFSGVYCYIKSDGTLYTWNSSSPTHTPYDSVKFTDGLNTVGEGEFYCNTRFFTEDGDFYNYLIYFDYIDIGHLGYLNYLLPSETEYNG